MIICGRVTPLSGHATGLLRGDAGPRPLQSTKTVSYSVGPAILGNRRVSPVALVPPVVAVSPVVAVLAVWRAVSPVLARRWFSFVHEGLSPAVETNGLR